MAVADIKTAEIVKENARSANDTGSPEVQVSLLTARINELTPPISRLTLKIITAVVAC